MLLLFHALDSLCVYAERRNGKEYTHGREAAAAAIATTEATVSVAA